MKKIIVSVTLLLTLLLNLGVSAAAAADPIEAAPLFMILVYSEEEESVIWSTAFYAEDSSGTRCLVTSDVVAQFQNTGYDDVVLLMCNGYEAEATLLGTDGGCAFYAADGMDAFEPMELASGYDPERVTFAFVESSDLESFQIDADSMDLTNWEWNGSCYVDPEETVRAELLGGVFVDEETCQVVGMGTCTEDLEMAMLPLTDVLFPQELALGSTEAAQSSSPAQTDNKGVGNWLDENGIWLAIAVVAVVVVCVLSKRKKSKKNAEQSTPVTYAENEVGADEGGKTVYIPEEPMPQQPETPTQAYGGWQLRGTEGIMYGQVFLLDNDTTIGRGVPLQNGAITFPENTQGISARHCKLTLQGERLVLRDLGSTYGTVLNGSRIEANIEYHLSEGDILALPGQQCFRLEKAGNSMQELTPAVQSVSGVTYRADLHGRVTFGRNPGAQVRFEASDTTISMNHCVLYREGGRLYLVDTSSNGTFFRADSRLRPNTPYPVKKGDTFFLASPKYSFVISED